MHLEHQYAGKPAQPINVGEPPLLWRCSHAVEPHQNRTRTTAAETLKKVFRRDALGQSRLLEH